MKKIFVIDACGLIALLRNEEGGYIIKEILTNQEKNGDTVLMHMANFCEVYYDTLRTSGQNDAEMLLTIIPTLGIQLTSEFSKSFIEHLGTFKIQGNISFADCFVLALSKLSNATILTSDRKEFERFSNTLDILFIR